MEEKKLPGGFKDFVKCLCIKCPSHTGCMKVKIQKVFCASGSTSCEVLEKGCICPSCSVAKKYGLKSMYYCKPD